MFHSLFNMHHLFADLDLAVIFAVTAAAIYLNDHLPMLFRNHHLFYRVVKVTIHHDFYWPVALSILGCVMLLFVTAQMAISSLFVLGYGLWLIHKTRSFVRV
jgi:hypothetical protein